MGSYGEPILITASLSGLSIFIYIRAKLHAR